MHAKKPLKHQVGMVCIGGGYVNGFFGCIIFFQRDSEVLWISESNLIF